MTHDIIMREHPASIAKKMTWVIKVWHNLESNTKLELCHHFLDQKNPKFCHRTYAEPMFFHPMHRRDRPKFRGGKLSHILEFGVFGWKLRGGKTFDRGKLTLIDSIYSRRTQILTPFGHFKWVSKDTKKEYKRTKIMTPFGQKYWPKMDSYSEPS